MAVDDAYTVALLHFDGSDESTTFTDESGKTWTAAGNAQLDTAQKVFGTAAGLFDGTGDYISTPYSADLSLGAGDFTIDFRAKIVSFVGSPAFVSLGEWSTGLFLTCNSTNFFVMDTAYYFAHGMVVDTWYHVALTRSGTDLRFFIDGIQKGSTLTCANDFSIGGSATSRIGYAAGQYMYGWLDEFRISKGIARWTANFTPPTEEYADPNVNVEATTATLTLSPNAANVNAEISFTTTVATLTIAANAAEVVPGTLVNASLAELTITPNAATVRSDVEIVATSVPLTITVNAADVFVGVLVDATLVELTIVSNSAEITTIPTILISEPLTLYSTLGWAWGKEIAEDLAFTEVVTGDIGISAREVLFLTDTLHNNWTGTEELSDTLGILGQVIIQQVFNETAAETLTIDDVSTYMHQMLAAIADTLGFTEEAISQADFYPVITEALAVTGLVAVLANLNNTAAETLTMTDTTGVGWGNVVADTLGITDTATILWYAMCALTDSITFTEQVLGQFQFSDTISDVLAFATTLALNQVLTNTIEETLDFGIVVELDDELWETWVLNTNQFNASVYSGYGFNSYSVFNNVAYGCKPDGVFKLSGTTDDGSAFKAGIVLPETYFGSVNKKRFRKAYFGLSGGVTPALRVETDSGSTTYTITNSKANITRDMYGKQWVLKVQDFDDLDFIELVPVILSR